MQKMTKGAVAAAAAALLLVGGGGTFMSWNQDDTFSDATISAGTLTLDTTTEGTWTLNDAPVDIATALIVPGDELVFTQPATIVATGNNIEGELKVVPGTISAVGEGDAGSELALALNNSEATTFEIETEDTGLTQVEFSPAHYEFLDAGTYEANLVATIDFDFDSVSGLVAQGGAANLAEMKLSLLQTDPNAPEEDI